MEKMMIWIFLVAVITNWPGYVIFIPLLSTGILAVLLIFGVSQLLLSCIDKRKEKRVGALYCPHCGKKLDQDKPENVCPRCYQDVTKNCPGCGDMVFLSSSPEDIYLYCEKCGDKFPLAELERAT